MPGLLMALWSSLIRFIASFFSKAPSAAPLPIPVTSRRQNPPSARPTSASVRAKSAATSPRMSPPCRSRSSTPKRDTEYIFHPPPSPFPKISLSGIFATTTSPRLASPPPAPTASPRSPSPFRASRASTLTLHSRSPSTPSSAVMVHLDRSTVSPTTMSDGSLEIISLGSPAKLADFARLPSPWSPVGKPASSDVWLSADGLLVNAIGPIFESQDDPQSATPSLSRISTSSLYSASSAFDALGISVFVNLDKAQDTGNNADSTPKLVQLRDENYPTVVTPDPHTPRKRRETISAVSSQAARNTKCRSTPLTKLDNVGVTHVRSATSISSMAYELRMGLFADGRSMTLENIISMLDQASPTLITANEDAAVVG